MAKKKQQTTVGFILDESGSMYVRSKAAVDGYNEFLQGVEKGTKVIAVSFSYMGEAEPTVRDIEDELTLGKNYRVRGTTPLYDAIGHLIERVQSEKGDGPVMIVILTDGLENASRVYTRERVRYLITEREKEGWKFIYLGAGQDQWEADVAAQAIGMSSGATYTFAATPSATASVMRSVTGTVGYVSTHPEATSAETTTYLRKQDEGGK